MKPLYALLLIGTCVGAFLETGSGKGNPRGTIRLVPQEYPTIQLAIMRSTHGDTVLVDEGTYVENIGFYGKTLVVASRLLVDGDASHVARTVISGGMPAMPDSASVIRMVSTNSVLIGFTIRDGAGTRVSAGNDFAGGGVFMWNSSARLVGNVIVSNKLTGTNLSGGGIYAIGDGNNELIMENNVINGNTLTSTTGVVQGGGAWISNMILTFKNNVISENSALVAGYPGGASGGGVYLNEANVTILNNRIERNIVGGSSFVSAFGGGLSLTSQAQQRLGLLAANFVSENSVVGEISSGSVAMRDEPVKGRRFSSGGGLYIFNENPRLENNIVVGNSSLFGGGIGLETDAAHAADAPVLVNNTISSNQATGMLGPGIYSRGVWTPKMTNSIVWGNTGGAQISLLEGSVMRVFYSDIEGGWPLDSGNFHHNPHFVTPEYRPSDGSLTIGLGKDSVNIGGQLVVAPAVDFAGNIRPQPVGSRPDVGAHEHVTAGIESQWSRLVIPQGWNMVSVPLDFADTRQGILFPAAISRAFCYEGRYVVENELTSGCGYWMKFPVWNATDIFGAVIDIDTMDLEAGWNIIGSLTETIPVNGMSSDPPGLVTSQVFGFSGTYVPVDSIVPGQAYWIKASQPAKLILETNDIDDAALAKRAGIRIVATGEMPPPPPESDAEVVIPQVPDRFALTQNYPNPFNPSTNVSFDIPTPSFVTVKIYDLLGREIAVLVNEERQPGSYTVRWNADGFSSGIYLCRMTSGTFSDVRKLILMK